MIRALSILAAVAALAVSAAPVTSAGTSKTPPSAKFLDQPKPVTSFKAKAGPSTAPHPAGNGIIAILIGAKAAPPPRSVTDGTSNTVMFGE